MLKLQEHIESRYIKKKISLRNLPVFFLSIVEKIAKKETKWFLFFYLFLYTYWYYRLSCYPYYHLITSSIIIYLTKILFQRSVAAIHRLHPILITFIVTRHCSGDNWYIWSLSYSLVLIGNEQTYWMRKLKLFFYYFL